MTQLNQTPEAFVVEFAVPHIAVMKAVSLEAAAKAAKEHGAKHNMKLVSVKTAEYYEKERDELARGKTLGG